MRGITTGLTRLSLVVMKPRKPRPEPRQRYPRTRSVRGLLLQVKSPKWKPASGRCLLQGLNKKGPPGRCVWCRELCLPRRWWHDDCVKAYFVAISTQTYPVTTLDRFRVCVECGKHGKEIDHRYPLALARIHQAEGKRGWWKAWVVSNLQFMCRGCHALKTRLDVAQIAYAKRLIRQSKRDEAAGVLALPL